MKGIKVLLLSLFLVGCATVAPISQEDLLAEGFGQFEQGFYAFYVPSRGAVPDSMTISSYRVQGTSRTASDLHGAFQLGHSNDFGIVVGGSNSELTTLVVEHALDLEEEGDRLAGLEVLVVGPRELTPDIIEKATSRGISIILSAE
ncbi:hypothetical protein E4656_12235 [Natronospirillum operosum]|uniref:Uncharacterized protein n=1 Tax=Natronospirillum operosum TaxID=2759953 RepID=A0A4Z0W6M4_9GAMM|nr:hypothetical protein [Natronospirillum operosum]TGG92885.1 hypothetical protein E4656_12235 [Natronospirillum operosum]